MFGLYRRAYGGEIVKSFYDFDTRSIGPYTLPVDLYYNVQASQGSIIPEYIMYKVLLSSSDILAVFNLNNSVIACVTEYMLREVGSNGLPDKDLPALAFSSPVRKPKLESVGFWKTFQENLTVTTLPYLMFRDIDTGIIDGTQIKCPDNIVVEPPIQLYKLLVDTSYDVVGLLWDYDKLAPIFIKERTVGDTKEFYLGT